jgi:hypothetical protein
MLTLDVVPPEILAYYQLPGSQPYVGGHIGKVYPGGSFLGLEYDQLLTLGTGAHEIVADPDAGQTSGVKPHQTLGDRLCGDLRWEILSFRAGRSTRSDVEVRALLAMTPENVARAALLLPEEWARRLREFVVDVEAYRERGGMRFCAIEMPSEGKVPYENLVALKQWFATHPDRSVPHCGRFGE